MDPSAARLRHAATLALLVVGFLASAALLVDYSSRAPVFCAEGGGCDALKQTAFAHPLGIQLPFLGILGLVVESVLALTRGKWVRLGFVVVAGLGGIVGLALLVVQVVVGHFCPYCAAADLSQIGLCALAVERLGKAWDPPRGPLASFVGSASLAAALAVPFLWAEHEARKLPACVAAELAQTPKGTALVVDFVDFECPFCRMTQASFDPVLDAEKGHVRLVRKMVPLTRIHPHALAAARAECCGELLGQGDAMAEALFKASPDTLTAEGCKAIAVSLGIPEGSYDACIKSPDVDARLARDRHDFDQAARKGDGLPLLWIGTRKLMGAQDPETLSSALREAREGS
jgi:uncharacterized membrane protein/protein-disulfide isomerase